VRERGESGSTGGEVREGVDPFYFNGVKENEMVFKTYAKRMLIRFKGGWVGGLRNIGKVDRNDANERKQRYE
jgi:hypothetical protein